MVGDGSGGAYVAWIENNDVAVTHVNGSGVVTWNSGYPVFLTYLDIATKPVTVADVHGGIVVLWMQDDGVDTKICTQRVSGAGDSQWTFGGVEVTTSTTVGPDTYGLAADTTGGAFVTWADNADGNIYAQRIAADGAPSWAAPVQIVSDGSYATISGDPRKTVEDGYQGFITTWLNGSNEIRAQRVDSDGNVLWTAGGAVLCNDASLKNDPRLAGNGQGAAAVIWADERNLLTSDIDIYVQGVLDDGTLGEPGYVPPPDGGGGGCAPGGQSSAGAMLLVLVMFGSLASRTAAVRKR